MSSAPSALLLSEATSTLPLPVTIFCATAIAAVVLLRATVIRNRPFQPLLRRQLDTHLNMFMTWWLFAALLRFPRIQDLLIEHMSINLSEVRYATHVLILMGAAAVWCAVTCWSSTHAVPRSQAVTAYGVMATASVAMWLVGQPAFAANIAVEELSSWRTGVYLTLYSLPLPLVEGRVLAYVVTAWRLFRRASVRIALLVFTWCTVTSIVDHTTRLIAGWFQAAGVSNCLTSWRANSSDLLFLPVLCFMALVLLVPVIPASLAAVRRDPDSRTIVRLQGLYDALTSADPDVVMPVSSSSRALFSSRERAHRMKVEIEDALVRLGPWLTPDTESWSSAERARAVASAMTIAQMENRRPTAITYPAWLTSDEAIADMADAWSEKRNGPN